MEKKRKASEHNPTPGDLPVEELIKSANECMREGWDVTIKFTCAWCGERVCLQEPNKIYPEGECCECGKITVIDAGGFLLTRELKRKEG